MTQFLDFVGADGGEIVHNIWSAPLLVSISL